MSEAAVLAVVPDVQYLRFGHVSRALYEVAQTHWNRIDRNALQELEPSTLYENGRPSSLAGHVIDHLTPLEAKDRVAWEVENNGPSTTIAQGLWFAGYSVDDATLDLLERAEDFASQCRPFGEAVRMATRRPE